MLPKFPCNLRKNLFPFIDEKILEYDKYKDDPFTLAKVRIMAMDLGVVRAWLPSLPVLLWSPLRRLVSQEHPRDSLGPSPRMRICNSTAGGSFLASISMVT